MSSTLHFTSSVVRVGAEAGRGLISEDAAFLHRGERDLNHSNLLHVGNFRFGGDCHQRSGARFLCGSY